MSKRNTDEWLCEWCLKRVLKAAEWEQKSLASGEYLPMCARCARKRLDNPYNALIEMRPITEGDHTMTHTTQDLRARLDALEAWAGAGTQGRVEADGQSIVLAESYRPSVATFYDVDQPTQCTPRAAATAGICAAAMSELPAQIARWRGRLALADADAEEISHIRSVEPIDYHEAHALDCRMAARLADLAEDVQAWCKRAGVGV